MRNIQKLTGLLSLLLALGMVVAGPVMIYKGFDGKAEVKSQLTAEKIVFTDDAEELVGRTPGEKVDTGAEAKDFATIIDKHALETTKGKTYAEMDREDPLRQVAMSSASLRTSLQAAYMADQVALLVIGLGTLFTAIGLLFGLNGYLLTQAGRKEEE